MASYSSDKSWSCSFSSVLKVTIPQFVHLVHSDLRFLLRLGWLISIICDGELLKYHLSKVNWIVTSSDISHRPLNGYQVVIIFGCHQPWPKEEENQLVCVWRWGKGNIFSVCFTNICYYTFLRHFKIFFNISI